MAAGLARGDVRLYRFAPPDKQRPVVILSRDSSIPYLPTVTIAPVASTIRGVPSEVVLDENDEMKSSRVVNLHKVMTVSQHRHRTQSLPTRPENDAGDLRGSTLLARMRLGRTGLTPLLRKHRPEEAHEVLAGPEPHQ